MEMHLGCLSYFRYHQRGLCVVVCIPILDFSPPLFDPFCTICLLLHTQASSLLFCAAYRQSLAHLHSLKIYPHHY